CGSRYSGACARIRARVVLSRGGAGYFGHDLELLGLRTIAMDGIGVYTRSRSGEGTGTHWVEEA
ncbi:MAG: hypothetical protein FWC40_07460, partial [Proteobacteria bacterium]|nr:hypothetical protein [Pseudomonadota bacterium]